MSLKLMECGHIGYAETKDGKPYCPICDCDKVVDDDFKVDLTGRKAKCWHCGNIVDSSYKLPFFEPKEKFNPKSEYDSYYCGCGGWD